MATFEGKEIKTDFNRLSFTYDFFSFFFSFPFQFSTEFFLLLSLCNYLTTLCHEKAFRNSGYVFLKELMSCSIIFYD